MALALVGGDDGTPLPGGSARQLDEPDEAISHYREVIRRMPECACHRGLGDALDSGRVEDAMAAYVALVLTMTTCCPLPWPWRSTAPAGGKRHSRSRETIAHAPTAGAHNLGVLLRAKVKDLPSSPRCRAEGRR